MIFCISRSAEPVSGRRPRGADGHVGKGQRFGKVFEFKYALQAQDAVYYNDLSVWNPGQQVGDLSCAQCRAVTTARNPAAYEERCHFTRSTSLCTSSGLERCIRRTRRPRDCKAS